MTLAPLRKPLGRAKRLTGRLAERWVERPARSVLRRLPISEASWAKFDLLRTLVRRDLEARYKGSVLGNLWPLVNQVAQLLIYTYVFSIVLKVKLSLTGLAVNENLTLLSEAASSVRGCSVASR